jgi:hypothetical protein
MKGEGSKPCKSPYLSFKGTHLWTRLGFLSYLVIRGPDQADFFLLSIMRPPDRKGCVHVEPFYMRRDSRDLSLSHHVLPGIVIRRSKEQMSHADYNRYNRVRIP